MKRGGLAFAILVAAWSAFLLVVTLGSGPTSRAAPLAVIVPTLALALLEVARTVRTGETGGRVPLPPERASRLCAWGGALLGLVWLLGFIPAVPVFLAPYLRVEAGLGWRRALSIAASVTAAFALVFGVLVRAPFPPGLLIG